ncbi:MAG TPA: hypothetical protein VFL64_21730 [Rhizobacter sp.]|nr:hypothetical protein [Rhizobacter sp.]
MPAQILMACSAAILFVLGCLHLLYTFSGSKLTPRDPALQTEMMRVAPVISRQTTMWKAWLGFNASHSFGAILFGLVYGQLAVAHPDWLFASPFLLGVGALMLGGLLVVGKAYWFSIPFRGIALSFTCYLAALALALFS